MVAEPWLPHTILDDFALPGEDLFALVDWLSDLVDGRVAAGVALPTDAHLLDHFLGALDAHGSDEQVLLVGEAAGELLLQWRLTHQDDSVFGGQALDRLSGILSVLEAIPAPVRVSSDLFFLSQLPHLGGAGPRGRDIRRQVIHAVALCPLADHADSLRRLFCDLMVEPEYAVAAFGGLQRLSVLWAIEQVPHLLHTLRQDAISPMQAIWNLFGDLEAQPEAARRLGDTLRRDVQATQELIGVLVRRHAAVRYPRAWAALQEGLAT